MSNSNYKICTIKLNKSTDQDLIEFLEGRPVSYIFREALKYYIANEPSALGLVQAKKIVEAEPARTAPLARLNKLTAPAGGMR